MKRYKHILFPTVSVFLLVCIALSYLVLFRVGVFFTATQEYSFEGEVTRSVITKDGLNNILEETYYETDEFAYFCSSPIVNPNAKQNWRVCYPTVALWFTYCSDKINSDGILANISVSDIGFSSEQSPQDVFFLLQFCKYLNLDIDKASVEMALESHYRNDESTYCYSYSLEDRSFSRNISATHYAVLAYSLLDQQCPNKDNIQRELFAFLEENEIDDPLDICMCVLLLHSFGISIQSINHISQMQSKIEEYEKRVLSLFQTPDIDDASLFLDVAFIVKTNDAMGKSNDCWNKISINDRQVSLLSESLSSAELTQAAIDVDLVLKGSINNSFLFGAIQESVAEYVTSVIATKLSMYDYQSSSNLMDIYFGMCLSDYCDFPYNKSKLKNTVSQLIDDSLSNEENQVLFLYFGLLATKKLKKTISLKTRGDIISICEMTISKCANASNDLVKVNLENALFACEILNLLNKPLTDGQRHCLNNLINNALNAGAGETALISEIVMINSFSNGPEISVDWKKLTANLSQNGGYKTTNDPNDVATIVTTAKMLRIDCVRALTNGSLLESFCNSFLQNGRLVLDTQDDGADLRVYFFYFRMLSEV